MVQHWLFGRKERKKGQESKKGEKKEKERKGKGS